MNPPSDGTYVRLSPSNPGVQRTLKEWIVSTGDVSATEQVEQPAPGEQGSIPLLIVTGGASAIIAAIKVLPDFIRSQRRPFSLHAEVHIGDRTRTVDFETEATLGETEMLLNELIAELRRPIDG